MLLLPGQRVSWQHPISQELFQGKPEQQRSRRTAQEVYNSDMSQGDGLEQPHVLASLLRC